MGFVGVTVFAPLRLVHRETISPAQLGRTLCTEVAEQVPYWIAVLTPAERPLLTERPTEFEQTYCCESGAHRRVEPCIGGIFASVKIIDADPDAR